MTNVVKFNRPKPKQPERKPNSQRPKFTGMPVWGPWAIFAVVVAVYYLVQYTGLFA